ncbi:DDB1- and CUL4-associated factor 10 isoform X2 [Belonocnema kinseyi]|uniref:DDB1- and CUL4-associated factor 10 isoform X2 n=1 Tax=Belonocnema kinseyi TaxID=2817044 RepID=UPI00143DFF86|nr:DDB1- and CUL4-associated factor 10 isoform X2 [Belonocnema kinseyi]
MPKIKTKLSINNMWLRQRELGISQPLGHNDRFHKTLYSSIQSVTSWDHNENLYSAIHGGVFNLEYSPDGSLLLAACEKKSVLMFDPLTRRLIRAIDNAHGDCVNCVRFLDQRIFATCSDDSTVALWDSRNLKQRIRTLQGHSNWVKNIEYCPNDGLLLTSGFDGSIYTWDINSFTENSCLYTRVFHTNGLMRTRLSPDASKMLICTTSGYLIIIHDLKLSTLTADLRGFKPNMYRLMQQSQTTIPMAANFTHLFSHKRKHNRVEFLTDFPDGNDAEVISSLQVHPQGWCALSRNISAGEKSEWTCVHDIQERDMTEVFELLKEAGEKASHLNDMPEESDESQQPLQPSRSGITSTFLIDRANRGRNSQAGSEARSSSFVRTDVTQPVFPSRTNNWQEGTRRSLRLQSRNSRSQRNSSNNFTVIDIGSRSQTAESSDGTERQDDAFNEESEEATSRGESSARDEERQRLGVQLNELRRRDLIDNRNFSTGNVELHVSSADVWEALVAFRETRSRRERGREIHSSNEWRDWMASRTSNAISVNLPRSSYTVVITGENRIRAPSQTSQTHQPMYALTRNENIHQNIPRLTHYIEEPNVGSGYIKELCFSADGRVICSPFGYGVRLLAFSNECQELSDCVPSFNESVQLHELATNASHADIVVSTKFSPRHCLLVSGCLSGRIVWHQPVV